MATSSDYFKDMSPLHATLEGWHHWST